MHSFTIDCIAMLLCMNNMNNQIVWSLNEFTQSEIYYNSFFFLSVASLVFLFVSLSCDNFILNLCPKIWTQFYFETIFLLLYFYIFSSFFISLLFSSLIENINFIDLNIYKCLISFLTHFGLEIYAIHLVLRAIDGLTPDSRLSTHENECVYFVSLFFLV